MRLKKGPRAGATRRSPARGGATSPLACPAACRRLYYSVKVLFLLYLQAPQLRGAEFVYNAFLRPLFQRNAPLIEARVSAFRDAGATIARAAGIDLAPAAAAAAGGGGGADAAEPTTADVFGPSRKEK